MKSAAIALLLCAPLFAGNCIDAPCSASTNYAWDATGTPDTRPGTWGTAASFDYPYQFKGVPAGYRIRVLRVYGDLVAWFRGDPAPGTHAGVLWGLLSSAVRNEHMTPAQDTCMIYLQGVVSSAGTRVPFDTTVSDGGLLEPDNKLISRVAVWLNDAGLPVHTEATMTVVYRFEKEIQ